MSQYFKAIILHGDFIIGWASPSAFMDGVKLMEHSYMDSQFVKTIEELISPEGKFYKKQLVWAGDYTEYESIEFCENNDVYVNNLFFITDDKLDLEIKSLIQQKIKLHDELEKKIHFGDESKRQIYLDEFLKFAKEYSEFIKNGCKEPPKKYYRYIVNHTKKSYVDKENPLNQIKNYDWNTIFHPLPLLVCEGNGLGAGTDYHGNNKHLCGIWSRNTISVENELPDGFTELIPNFY